MIKDIKKGHTLLVRGPTRITLLEGKIEVMGRIILPQNEGTNEWTNEGTSSDRSEFEDANVLIIPGANMYPLYAMEKSNLEIYTNHPDENLDELEENSISDKWIEIKDSILNE